MFSEITEGKTRLLVPAKDGYGETDSDRPRKAPVFFNPRMKLNRDVTCSVVRALIGTNPELTFLDLLAGSGAKGVRVARETGAPVHLNDGNEEAVAAIRENSALNNLDVTITCENANKVLHDHFNKFDFIDLDPFGTPVPFIDNAVMMAKTDGCLGITATDTAPLCGVYPESCYRKYSAVPLRGEFCHEVGLRILVGHTARAAARYARGIECFFSHSTDHYFRAFIRLNQGKEKAKESLREMGYVYYCPSCFARETSKGPLPEAKNCPCGCGKPYKVAGPLWLGTIKDDDFCGSLIESSAYLEGKRLTKLITTIRDELHQPFYYDIHRVCDALNVSVPSMEIIFKALSDYRVTRTHFNPTAIKTNAPVEEIKRALS
jgi:tRNA (guanine26-N2/guanine27-N2)-dimethyltransferase